MLPPVKLGWMAGVIDLKGTFVLKNNKMRRTKQTVLIVETKNIQIVRELGSLTGTSPELQDARLLKDFMRRGCQEHCPEAHVHVIDHQYRSEDSTMPPIARWTVTGSSLVIVLHNLLPFFVLDKGHKEVMDEVISNTPLTGQGSGAVAKSIRRLSLLGWELPEEFSELEE